MQCPGTCGSREFALVLHRRHDLQFLARAHSDVRVDTALQRGNAHEDTDSSNRHYAVPFDQRRAPLSQVLPPGLSLYAVRLRAPGSQSDNNEGSQTDNNEYSA